MPFMILALGAPFLMLALYQYFGNRSAAPGGETAQRAPHLIVGIIITSVVASTSYRLLIDGGLGQTAALFIGIPALLALSTLFVPARSATGVVLKTVTIGLLISLIVLREGVLCVVMSAPLFYFVALMMGWAMRKVKSPTDRGRLLAWLPMLAIVPMSMEGVTPLTSLTRSTTVSETRTVNASAAAVAAAIVGEPRFDRTLPRYLSMGFPRPTSARTDGSRWVIRMRGGEMRLDGMEPRAGDLVLDRDAHGPGFVSWKAVSDDSHMRHFLTWESSRAEWTAIDAHTTRVTWTLRYRRDLDPAWYFGPMERYAVHLAAGYLIDAVATP